MPYKPSQLRAMFAKGGKSKAAALDYLRNRKKHTRRRRSRRRK